MGIFKSIADKISDKHHENLKKRGVCIGQTREDVKFLLGPPSTTKVTRGKKVYETWTYKSGRIKQVRFTNYLVSSITVQAKQQSGGSSRTGARSKSSASRPTAPRRK